MTREEAIKIIKSECYVFNPFNFDCPRMINTALDMAIKALKQEPCEDCISRQAVFDQLAQAYDLIDAEHRIKKLTSVTPKPKTGYWNNHQIACMLADLFGDACACNYNGIDEWLSELCDFKDTCCPHPAGVACWEQFLKHRTERRTDE